MPAPGQHVFSEKVALIADASTPVGRAVAIQLALYGCYVIAAQPDSRGESPVFEELKSLGTLAESFTADLSSSAGAWKVAEGIDGIYGRLDLLVSYFRPEPVVSPGENEAHDRPLDELFRPYHHLTRECLRLMEGRPKPSILNIVDGWPDESEGSYATDFAMRSAVIAYTKHLAGSLPPNYRVNAISVRNVGCEEKAEVVDPLFRKPEAVDPDDVARTAIFLLSSESKALNGELLKVG